MESRCKLGRTQQTKNGINGRCWKQYVSLNPQKLPNNKKGQASETFDKRVNCWQLVPFQMLLETSLFYQSNGLARFQNQAMLWRAKPSKCRRWPSSSPTWCWVWKSLGLGRISDKGILKKTPSRGNSNAIIIAENVGQVLLIISLQKRVMLCAL